MMALALYAVSAALYAAPPSSSSTVQVEALAAPIAHDRATASERRDADADARLHARRAPLRDDGAARPAADDRATPDRGFKEADDAARFQQQTWTGP